MTSKNDTSQAENIKTQLAQMTTARKALQASEETIKDLQEQLACDRSLIKKLSAFVPSNCHFKGGQNSYESVNTLISQRLGELDARLPY